TDFAVARYHTDGSLDTAFSSDGLATYDLAGGTDVARSIIIDTNGKYVLAGTAGSDFGMIRIETSGALDTSFSGDGIFTIDFNTTTETGYDVTLQTDGKFVVVGQTVLDFGIVRVQPSGVLDTDFAYGGKLSIDIGGGTTDEARAVKIDSQQRIVVIGIGGSVDFAAIRLLP
ncbi:MAG: hypothetical protein KDD51_10415, partial [Bdellovibrionales bacterium]|nr:hypothetical protein [Bdellovibrionales bacterium]